MLKKLILLIVAGAVSAAGYSFNDWLSLNGTNEFNYLRQKEDGFAWKWDILQAELWAWRFAVGGEAEFDHPRKPTVEDPTSWGPEGDEVVQRYARYRDDMFDVRAGHFDKTLGKGLTVRSYEDRDLEVYQRLDGGVADVCFTFGDREWGEISALWGRNRHDEELQEHDDRVGGGQITFRPFDFLYLTASGAEAEVENTQNYELEKNTLYAGGLGGGWKYFDVYGEYATRESYDSLFLEDIDGKGFYGIATGYLPRSSVSFEYKYYDHLTYRYNNPPPVSFDEKMITGSEGQGPPSEWGYFAQVTANPVDDVRFRGGYNYADNAVGELTEKDEFVEGYFANARYDLPWPVVVEAGYEYVGDVNYILGVPYGDTRSIPSLAVAWTVTDDHSISAEAEREERRDFTWGGRLYTYNRGSLGYTYSSWLGLTVSYEDTNQTAQELINPGDPPLEQQYRIKNNWLWGEVRLSWYHPKFQNHVLTIGYGSKRGGLICSSGVCQQEAPFSGLKVALESTF
ncbi:MAG: hypothetical protein JSU81_01570 [Candidatus Coatesbacteria bacterium]|nr:MAG: hypothetical protein JSU81_01570 [Candidatus Coatesbacteria bacterium]